MYECSLTMSSGWGCSAVWGGAEEAGLLGVLVPPLLAHAFVFSLLVVRKTRAAGSRPHTSRVSHWDRDYCVLCFHIV